jgi:predicted CoA-binding protein
MNSPRRPPGRDLAQIYAHTKTIAVVGASASEEKTAHAIPAYLQSQGYRIIPVNPHGGEILGERVYSSLHEVDVPVDVVDVFRRRPSQRTSPARPSAWTRRSCGSSPAPRRTRRSAWRPTLA